MTRKLCNKLKIQVLFFKNHLQLGNITQRTLFKLNKPCVEARLTLFRVYEPCLGWINLVYRLDKSCLDLINLV